MLLLLSWNRNRKKPKVRQIVEFQIKTSIAVNSRLGVDHNHPLHDPHHQKFRMYQQYYCMLLDAFMMIRQLCLMAVDFPLQSTKNVRIISATIINETVLVHTPHNTVAFTITHHSCNDSVASGQDGPRLEHSLNRTMYRNRHGHTAINPTGAELLQLSEEVEVLTITQLQTSIVIPNLPWLFLTVHITLHHHHCRRLSH